MKRLSTLLASLLVFLSVALAPLSSLAQPSGAADASRAKDETQSELSLAVGETRTIPANDVKNYSEGTKGIADFRPTPDGNNFIIVGLKPGNTSLLLIKNNRTQVNWVVNVFARVPDVVEKELQQLFEGYTGIRVRRVGARLFLEGGVATEGELGRIKQIADLYKGQVESLVTVGAGAGDRKLNIRIDLFFVQYVKSSAYNFGLSWSGRIGGQFIKSELNYNFVSRVATAQASLVDQPLPGLDIAANNGWAKVLKQATVITTNGNQATFNNGGELNFPINTGLTVGIGKVAFGTNIDVLPRYDPTTRNMEVQVSAEVSDLTAPSGGSLPGLQTSRLSTLVLLKLGQSLVISGIRTSSQRHAIDGLPLLSQIPVFGVFFGTHSDSKEELEGAVIVVPSVVEASPKTAGEILKETLAQYEKFSGSMDDVHTFVKRAPMPADAPRRN